jgi:hypothetical protein
MEIIKKEMLKLMLDNDCQFKIIDNNEFPLTGLIQVLLYI